MRASVGQPAGGMHARYFPHDAPDGFNRRHRRLRIGGHRIDQGVDVNIIPGNPFSGQDFDLAILCQGEIVLRNLISLG